MNRLSQNQLNYADYNDLFNHRDCLNQNQVMCLETAFSPTKRSNFKYREQYYDNACFVVGAEPRFVQKYCFCGVTNPSNRSGRCKQKHFCQRCAYALFYKHWQNFKYSYHQGSFQFLTFSWTGSIAWSAGNLSLMTAHWDSIKVGLNALHQSNQIRGYIACEELAVIQFLPTSVNPHCHAIVESDPLNENTLLETQITIASYLQTLNLDFQLHPSLKFEPIEREDEFKSKFEYLFKPINLKIPYTSAWTLGCGYDRSLACNLNNQVKDFMIGFTELTKGVNRSRIMTRLGGNMHQLSRNYIGEKK